MVVRNNDVDQTEFIQTVNKSEIINTPKKSEDISPESGGIV